MSSEATLFLGLMILCAFGAWFYFRKAKSAYRTRSRRYGGSSDNSYIGGGDFGGFDGGDGCGGD